MKSGTESKSKFRQLKRRLQLRYWQVVGILETLWRVTQADAPAGDIGKLDDEEIAAALEWEGDPGTLINALVETRWIDQDDDFRLIIHDWSEHAPNHLVGAFRKHGKLFADQIAKQRKNGNGVIASDDAKQCAKQPARQGAIAACPSTVPKHHATKPSQTNSNQTNSSHPQTPADSSADGLAGGWDVDSLARANLALQACGYKRFKELVSECRVQGLQPSDIVEVCREYEANAGRFSSPGAIAERLRSGVWPVNDVLPIQKAEEKQSLAQEKATRKEADSLRFRLVRSGISDARDWNDEEVFQRAKEHGLKSQ
jgi:hypothetical protein